MTERYLLDARPAMSRSTGVGNYVRGLAQGFSELQESGSARRHQAQQEQLVLFTSSWSERPDVTFQALAQRQGLDLQHRRLPVRVLNFLWHYLQHPKIERLVGPLAIAHSPHPLLLPAAKAAQVVTVHDLYFLEQREHTYSEVRRDYGGLLWKSLSQADAILCVSESTKQDLLNKAEGQGLDPSRLEDKVTVTPNGVDADYFAARSSREAQEPASQPPSPFLLAVGRIEPRKNPERVLRAFADVTKSQSAPSDASAPASATLRLVWAGMAADKTAQQSFDATVQRLGLSDRVQVLGYMDRDRLRALYHSAKGLVFPSLHEGFGLPILEAMASGCPVLTSNVTAMPEVAGDAALLVDPSSTRSIADGLRLLLQRTESETERSRLVERGRRRAAEFSWRTTASATIEVYRQLNARGLKAGVSDTDGHASKPTGPSS